MCDCITKINKEFAEYNGLLETNWLSNPPRAMVAVCKLESRKQKPPLMEAAYCPFCGSKYPKKRGDLAAQLQGTIS
jgi:hypothetical protein